MTNLPAVSVIIPLYNAQNFIAECLDSLLIQTFQDFEVIVVDDCSVDNSAKIVESYLEKFGGRLKLSRTKKNSGRPALPRNKGLNLSRGEYVFFMDNDDLLMPTALEEMYTLAKNYDAEVVYCEKHYVSDISLKNIRLATSQQGNLIEKPTFESDFLSERLDKIMKYMFVVMPWTKFIRRDFLIEHEIIFPDIIRDDDIWTWSLVFYAKKFLRVPNAVYIWRNVENSITRVEKTPAQEINFWLNPVICGVKILDKIMSRHEFFQKNPDSQYLMLGYFMEVSFTLLLEPSRELTPFEFYDAIREKFSDELGEQGALIPLMCSFINAQQRLADSRSN